MKTLDQVELKGKRTFVRVDFNVPLTPQGEVADDSRIRASLPTIEYGLAKGARLVLASHLGRPVGVDPRFSLEPAGVRLSELLDEDVVLADDCVGDGVRRMVQDLKE